MKIFTKAVGRRKEAVAQIQIIQGTGQFIINNKNAQEYLQASSQKYTEVKSPFEILETNLSTNTINLDGITLDTIDTIVKVKGGGISGQADAIKLGIARAFCNLANTKGTTKLNQTDSNVSELIESNNNLSEEKIKMFKKQFKTEGYLTQDSRIKERRKYGLKKARKASQYHKR